MATIRDDDRRTAEVHGNQESVEFIWRDRITGLQITAFLREDNADLTALAAELSKLDGFTATYERPKPPEQELPSGIGAVVASSIFEYVRVAANRWQNTSSPHSVFTDEEMKRPRRSANGYKPYVILSEGVEL